MLNATQLIRRCIYILHVYVYVYVRARHVRTIAIATDRESAHIMIMARAGTPPLTAAAVRTFFLYAAIAMCRLAAS